MAYVEFINVTKAYHMGDNIIKATDDVSFKVEKGEMCVILGASGAGKTTILNILGGMDTCDSGSVIVDGLDITKLNEKGLTKYRRSDVGFVFQFYNLMPNLTALENIDIASEICKNPMDSKEALEAVQLSERMNNFPSQLSGGEQQRVVIARAIVNRPKLLICDEPTGNLDPDTSMEIMKVLENINNMGTTIIMATHDRTIVDKMKKRVILIEEGRLKRDYEKGTYYNERY